MLVFEKIISYFHVKVIVEVLPDALPSRDEE